MHDHTALAESVHKPFHYGHLPTAMQQEYDEFIVHLLKAKQIQPITIETRIAGHVLRYMRFCHEKFNHQSVSTCKVEMALTFISSLPQMKKTAANKIRQSIKSLLEWQYIKGMIGGEDLTKYDLTKPAAKHYASKPPRCM